MYTNSGIPFVFLTLKLNHDDLTEDTARTPAPLPLAFCHLVGTIDGQTLLFCFFFDVSQPRLSDAGLTTKYPC